MTCRFGIVGEAVADIETTITLADRVILDSIDWITAEDLDSQREWCRTHAENLPLTWSSIAKQARKVGFRVHGHFDGEPAEPDAKATRRAIEYLHHSYKDLAGIVLVRDQDSQASRYRGMMQAVRTSKMPNHVAIGMAIVEREAWLIAGFEAQDQLESDRHQEIVKELNFDPCLSSHDLTDHKSDQSKKSPKRVLAVLTQKNSARQAKCLQIPLARHQERGVNNGLSDFLNQIRSEIATVIGHVNNQS
jgi:G3E family GTPase